MTNRSLVQFIVVLGIVLFFGTFEPCFGQVPDVQGGFPEPGFFPDPMDWYKHRLRTACELDDGEWKQPQNLVFAGIHLALLLLLIGVGIRLLFRTDDEKLDAEKAKGP